MAQASFSRWHTFPNVSLSNNLKLQAHAMKPQLFETS